MRTLRFGLSLAFAGALIASGCGDDDRPGGGVDSGPGPGTDGGPGTDSGPLPDSGPVPDGGDTDSGPGTSMCPAGDCDLVAQTGCEGGQGCYFLAPGEGEAPEPLCDTSGTTADGAACSTYNDCQEGFFCDSTAGICRSYCCMGSDAGCPTGQSCAVQLTDPDGGETGVGYCATPDTCDPVAQTGCDVSTDGCYARNDGSMICIGSLANTPEGGSCGATNDCEPGTACYSTGDADPICHKYCDTTDDTTCGAEQTCNGLGLPDPLGTVGICTPAAGT